MLVHLISGRIKHHLNVASFTRSVLHDAISIHVSIHLRSESILENVFNQLWITRSCLGCGCFLGNNDIPVNDLLLLYNSCGSCSLLCNCSFSCRLLSDDGRGCCARDWRFLDGAQRLLNTSGAQ